MAVQRVAVEKQRDLGVRRQGNRIAHRQFDAQLGLAGIGDIGLTDLADAHGRWRQTEERRFGPDRLEVYARTRSA